MRPIDGAQAHRARLAGGIDVASGEVERAQTARSLAYAVHLGVRRRVVVDSNAVRRLGDDFVATYDDRSERSAASAHTLLGEFYGTAHKFVFLVHIFIFL